MGFPKGASIPFGQERGQYPAREVAAFIGYDGLTPLWSQEPRDAVHRRDRSATRRTLQNPSRRRRLSFSLFAILKSA